jgi:hypothetical protein
VALIHPGRSSCATSVDATLVSSLQAAADMRRSLLVLLLIVSSPSIARADDALDVQVGVANEHAGLGVGVELGDGPMTLVTGLGAAVGLGYSSVEGWIGAVAPGLGVGLRRYLGGWYFGPTVGANLHVWSSRDQPELFGTSAVSDGWTVWGAADVGHRWRLGAHGAWSMKLGLSGGVARVQDESGAVPLVGLTFTIGR